MRICQFTDITPTSAITPESLAISTCDFDTDWSGHPPEAGRGPIGQPAIEQPVPEPRYGFSVALTAPVPFAAGRIASGSFGSAFDDESSTFPG